MGVGFTTKHSPWEGYGQFLKQHINKNRESFKFTKSCLRTADIETGNTGN